MNREVGGGRGHGIDGSGEQDREETGTKERIRTTTREHAQVETVTVHYMWVISTA